MVVLIDLDSTIVDIMTPALKELNSTYDKSIVLEDLETWDTIATLFPRSALYKVLQTRGFYKDKVLPIQGSKEFLSTLKHQGHELLLVTAGMRTVEKEVYIDDHFGEYFSDVVFEQDKHKISGDFLVDDRFSTVRDWVKNTGKKGLLYRHHGLYQYNDIIWDNMLYKRCNTYKQVLEEIQKGC